MRLGFIGTGNITAAIVEGLGGGVVLSPRGAAMAADLAARFPDVTVAESNQAVVDQCDMVVLAIRPQVAEEVVRSLRFRAGQKLLSLVAATPVEVIRGWAGLDLPVIRAIPLPFVADRRCVTPILPPDAEVAALFDRLGQAVECQSQMEFDLLAVGSALMGSYFGLLEAAEGWLVERGLPEAAARDYMAGLFANLGRVAEGSGKPFGALREEYSTRGGLNEQVFRVFGEAGGVKALRLALDQVLERVKG
ncbi:MAG: pyrroline-5-carboxylate reductase [Tabrizicola flagellatus]|uniref:pyrroline-5-carboxylate reductase n=1 Tax=Tabrizicola flagellatus TaxID=2593021 RepID=UPI00391BD6C1